MILSKEEILKIANLAKLELSAEEIAAFPGQLSDVLSYFDKLTSLDLKNVEPFISELSQQKSLLRSDIVGVSDKSSMDQFVKVEDDYLVVPQVLAKK
ncbi:Asp-tRNA(Asn)/Glu-tRNA(Gln) amidotransferase subunit GatC [Patescibacteria group bacterium]|nr:Asp-tRNA(Asn)/Glu-tRNA(Gln) amidotransferase subunit GatC [Patescibacteria group bacterium]